MAKLSTDELLDTFKEMTLLELSEFVKQFEETFDVTAAAPVAVAGVAAPAAGGGDGGAAAAESAGAKSAPRAALSAPRAAAKAARSAKPTRRSAIKLPPRDSKGRFIKRPRAVHGKAVAPRRGKASPSPKP